MEAEIEAENSTPFQEGSVVVASGEYGDSDDDASESSEDYIAEVIVGHVGGNKSRKYIVRCKVMLQMTRPRSHHVSLERFSQLNY